MKTKSNCVLVSIWSKYVEMMRQGTKRVELRKSFPDFAMNVYVYECSPVGMVTGLITMPTIKKLPVDILWERTKDISGVSKDEFFEYFRGKEEGYGVFFDGFDSIDPKPITNFGLKKPPQNYVYIDPEVELKIILNK